jgi:integrase/recombinase XerD
MKGKRPLSDEELASVTIAPESRYSLRDRTLFTLGVNLGARISELLSLTIGDIWQEGKPVEAIYFKRRNTKGKHAGRSIPVNTTVATAIGEFMAGHDKQDKRTPVFLGQKGTAITVRQADRILRRIFSENGLTGNLATHTMRKTFATRLNNKGVNLRVIQELLGHSSLAVTEKYLRIDAGDLRDAVDRL